MIDASRTSQREYLAEGSPTSVITEEQVSVLLDGMLDHLGRIDRCLLIPPDFTRYHSGAGFITMLLWEKLHRRGASLVRVLPALGTHKPMSLGQLDRMYPGIPRDAIIEHHWRTDLAQLGEVPGDFLARASGGRVDYSVTCEINRHIVEGDWDRIISIGQVVPHEVVGIANHNKNIFVGTGGRDTINKTHFLGAVCNMESIMGRAETPVRSVLDYMSDHFAARLPITYILTVRATNAAGNLETRGVYAGDGKDTYRKAAALSQQVNLDLIEEPLPRVVVWLDPEEFHSTWLGNKAVYRTRMAIADMGELIILAPGVRMFGEDPAIDALIRRFGYIKTPSVLEHVRMNTDGLGDNLSAAAHLIHGSSEGRFRIIYCPGGLSREETELVGYEYRVLDEALKLYNPGKMHDGWNEDEQAFFIRNPALGLWALAEHFR